MPFAHNREQLLSRIAAGQLFQFVFFWGHRPEGDGRIGPSCCSQWFDAGFELGGVHYATAEHYMMAQKAHTFGDIEAFEQVLLSKSPEEVKKIGRKVRNFDARIWSERRIGVVEEGNLAKFTQNPTLGIWLRDSAPSVLVEASPEDAIWGIGLHRDDPRAQDPSAWPGKNLLGFALMTVRDQLFEV